MKMVQDHPNDTIARHKRQVASYSNETGSVRISLSENMDPDDWYVCISIDGRLIVSLPDGRPSKGFPLPTRYEKYERISANGEMAALSYFNTLCMLVSGWWMGFWSHMDHEHGVRLIRTEEEDGTELEESGS